MIIGRLVSAELKRVRFAVRPEWRETLGWRATAGHWPPDPPVAAGKNARVKQ